VCVYVYSKERIFDPKPKPSEAELGVDKSIIEVAAACDQTLGMVHTYIHIYVIPSSEYMHHLVEYTPTYV
jgi:hypothetical protein